MTYCVRFVLIYCDLVRCKIRGHGTPHTMTKARGKAVKTNRMPAKSEMLFFVIYSGKHRTVRHRIHTSQFLSARCVVVRFGINRHYFPSDCVV